MASRQLQLEIGRRNVATSSVELLSRTFRAIGTWRQRKLYRASLRRLDSNILRDVGISEAERFIEVNKPFWEA